MRLCPDCGNPVVTKGRHRCEPCREKAEAARYQRRLQTLKEARRTGREASKQANAPVCEHCGKPFWRPRHRMEAGRFCSRECAFAHATRLAAEAEARRKAEAEAERERKAVARRNSRAKQLVWRFCECGAPITRGEWCKACARKRSHQIRKHIHRAQHFGVEWEWIDKRGIFERDKWTCQTCGRGVSLHVPVQDSEYATLGHGRDLCEGGPHVRDNVMCQCWECNWKQELERKRKRKCRGAEAA
jgi:hypothetical protein